MKAGLLAALGLWSDPVAMSRASVTELRRASGISARSAWVSRLVIPAIRLQALAMTFSATSGGGVAFPAR
jgi:hypothetical protein